MTRLCRQARRVGVSWTCFLHDWRSGAWNVGTRSQEVVLLRVRFERSVRLGPEDFTSMESMRSSAALAQASTMCVL